MSVSIYFYKTTDKKRELNKSLVTSSAWMMTGLIHTPCDIMNPIIEIEETADVNPLKFTYLEISSFSRYYFIEKAVCIRTGRWMIYCHEDVLMSHQSYILSLSAFVTRWENSTNIQLRDEKCNFQYKKYTVSANVTNRTGASVKTLTVTPDTSTGYNTIVAYMTDQVDHYSLGSNSFQSAPQPTSYVTGANASTAYYAGVGGIAFDIARAVYKNSAMKSYIKHITMYPFVISTSPDSAVTSIKIGDTSVPLGGAFRYPTSVIERILIADFEVTSSDNSLFYIDDFTAAEPYSNYELYIPYVGWIPIASVDLYGKRIRVWYAVNYEEGSATAYVSSGTDISNIIYSAPCTMGTKISLSYDNTRELETARNALYLNTAASLGSTALASSNGGDASGLNAASGLLKTGAAFVNGWNALIPRGNAAINSSSSGLNISQVCRLRLTRVVKSNYDAGFKSTFGVPYNKFDALASLGGFVQVGEIQMIEDNAILDDEKKEIEAILKSGYIYTLPTP